MNSNPSTSRRGPGTSVFMTLIHILGAVLLGLLGFAGASAVVDGRW